MISFYIGDDQEKLNPSSRASLSLQWGFKTYLDSFISLICCLATVGSVYGLTVAYPDNMRGPTYLLSFLAYAPFVYACMMYRESLAQIYIGSFLTLVSIWLIIPLNVGLSPVYGLPFGVGFWVLTSVSLPVWFKASSGAIDLGFVIRLVCLFMLTAYVVANVYGILVSVGIQFYRAPFFLQPIVVLSFASLEGLVMLVNCLVAWIAFEMVTKGAKSMMRWRNNPIVLLVGVFLVWVALAGIIYASQRSIATVKVSTMGSADLALYSHKDAGEAIRNNIIASGAKFVVLPEFFFNGNDFRTCDELIKSWISPQVAGLGAYVTVGCLQYSSHSSCSTSNLAITIGPDGSIVSTYGKMRPTPGEKSCSQPGYFAHQFTPVSGPGFKFSPLICYDMDFIEPAAKSADLGSSLIVNPSNDWNDVRNHFAASVIKAVENRVAIVKAERRTDAAIIDPFGNVAAFGGGDTSTSLTAEIPVSQPLQVNMLRQHFVYWIFIVGYAIFTGYDIYSILRKCK